MSWLIYPALGQDIADALTPAAVWEALWPVLIGAVLATEALALGDTACREFRKAI